MSACPEGAMRHAAPAVSLMVSQQQRPQLRAAAPPLVRRVPLVAPKLLQPGQQQRRRHVAARANDKEPEGSEEHGR